MKSLYSAGSRYSLVVLAIIVVGLVISGQGMGKTGTRTGYPEDWSHHHLIFSAPSNAAQAVELSKNPRYQQQWLRRNAAPAFSGVSGNSESASSGTGHEWSSGLGSKNQNPLHRDWNMSLGPGGTVGAGQYPAKYAFTVSAANCEDASQPDYVVFNTGLAGSGTQATVIAFDNLYSNCLIEGPEPNPYWAYDTQGTALTSPILSLDGTQVAYVQNHNITGAAELVILKWTAAGGTISSPGTNTYNIPSAYRGCSAPCYTEVPLTGAVLGDSNSAPFLDYGHDKLWVGDDSGVMHEVDGVFTGTPTELTTAGWPAAVSAANKLTSPVQDQSAGLIFVGSANGELYQVAESNGAVTASAQLGVDLGIVASPVLDSTSRLVYAFVGEDTTDGSACGATSGEGCNGVFQFGEPFGAGASGTEAVLGPSPDSFPLYEGNFNNSYYTSGDATGGMFVCGTDAFEAGEPAMYLIPINAGTMGAAIGGSGLTNNHTNCSPVTEFYNPNLAGGTDSIFWSVENGSLGASCGLNLGCVNSSVITAWQPSTAYVTGQVILDTNFDIEIVKTGGTSGTMQPTWPIGVTTTGDGTVTWINQGAPTIQRPSGWSAGTSYTLGALILDSNGNYEYCIKSGRSKGTPAPIWSTTIGMDTADGGAIWENLGPPTAFSFEATGGTSGIIIDNASTAAGASQIYFSNLASGSPSCGSGNTCAVQISQAKLQ